MSDQTVPGVPSGETAPQLRVLTQYIKDLSFENPNAPRLMGPLPEQPQIGVQVDVTVRRLGEADFEVTLAVDIEAKAKEDVMFLVELEYCGLFRLTNIPAESLEPLLLVECPRQIFPFARRIIADVTRDGGFPPLMIDPIDFVNLYQQRYSEAAEAGAKPN
jgi:preprotein translocase subunit SecB